MESTYHDISFKKFGCKESSKHTLKFQISMPFLFDKDAFLIFFFIQLPNLSFTLNSTYQSL